MSPAAAHASPLFFHKQCPVSEWRLGADIVMVLGSLRAAETARQAHVAMFDHRNGHPKDLDGVPVGSS